MYSKEIEELIDMALADGVLTEKERGILCRRAQAQGIDMDEFEMVLDGRLAQMKSAVAANKGAGVAVAPPLPGSNAPAPRKTSDKYGNVRKCPACGALLKSFETACPQCGHELTEVAATSTLRTFYHELKSAHNTSDKDEIINSMPVPNTREDLFEVLNMAVSRAATGENRDAWANKANQVYQKIVITMSGDEDMLNRATDLIISMLKLLPKNRRNIANIPAEHRQRVHEEMRKFDAQFTRRRMYAILFAIAVPVLTAVLIGVLMDLRTESGLVAFIGLMLLIGWIPITIWAVSACDKKLKEIKQEMPQ